MNPLRELLEKIRQRFSKEPSMDTPASGVGRFREMTRSLQANLRQVIRDKKMPANFEPTAVANWMQKGLQKQGSGFYLTATTIVICTYFLSQIASIQLARFIPEPPTASSYRSGGPRGQHATVEDYNAIIARNLVNSKGLIPGEETGVDQGGAPVRTTLPLNLIGTLVLRDELKSVATIEDKSASMVYPMRIQDEIPSKLKILSIEPFKVVFVNSLTGRREFIDIPEDAQSRGPRISVSSTRPTGGGGGGGIEQVSPTQFNVQRTEVDKALSNFNQVLTQARAVPHFENGLPAGYKLFQIVPGSIYDKLGLKNGDIISGLNGQGINDPGKAFEMLNELKTSSHMELSIKREGKVQNFAYDIR